VSEDDKWGLSVCVPLHSWLLLLLLCGLGNKGAWALLSKVTSPQTSGSCPLVQHSSVTSRLAISTSVVPWRCTWKENNSDVLIRWKETNQTIWLYNTASYFSRDLTVSNLDWHTDYPDRDFRGSIPVSPPEIRDITLKQAMTTSSYIPSNSSFINNPAVWRCIVLSYPCNRPWRPIWLWDVETPTFSRKSAHWCGWSCNRPWRPTGFWDVEASTFCLENRLTDGDEVVAFYPPGRFLVLISIKG
jgi:hypothetical protein